MSVRAKKSLGQHFLVDLNVARKIVAAIAGGEVSGGLDGDLVGQTTAPGTIKVLETGGLSESAAGLETDQHSKRTVLEIGGGMGVLTQFLLERDDIELFGIELDRESIAYMNAKFPEFAPRLIEGDFLRFDLEEYFKGKGPVGIVGNFPYNISSQIFFKVLAHRDMIPEVVGMVQKEVAERIATPPGSRTYGILSVLLQAWYDIEYLFTVSETVFSPPPKVKSAVIRLKRNSTQSLGCDEVLFTRVVKAAFNQRRKMLRNALGNGLGLDLAAHHHELLTQRAEKLSVAQFVELTNWVASVSGRRA